MRHGAPVLRGPIRDRCFANDEVSIQDPPVAGIAGTVAVASDNELLEFAHHLRPPGTAAGSSFQHARWPHEQTRRNCPASISSEFLLDRPLIMDDTDQIPGPLFLLQHQT